MSQSPSKSGNSPQLYPYAQAWSALNMLIRQGHSFSGNERHNCFLNLGEGRFADVSAAAGMDLPEDGRAIALVDWDHDGDLDMWMSNRTSPRIRFFRNDYPRDNNFLSIRLEGRTCNRDAIGARLELSLGDSESHRRIKSVTAGDGFLGQSTKSVYFGIGKTTNVRQLRVQWPGGDVETFVDLDPNQHYRIIQGSGLAQSWTPTQRESGLKPAKLNGQTSSERTRIVLTGRIPVPDATFHDRRDNTARINKALSGPTLINLWATSCQPCLVELERFSRRAADLRAADIRVLALLVDENLDEATIDKGESILHRMDFPFQSGHGSHELIQSLDLVQRMVLDRQRPLPVPSSFLVDRHGQVAVIYKGPVTVEQLIADTDLLEYGPARLREAAVPFAGRWFTPPSINDPLIIAHMLEESDLTELAQRYCGQLLAYFDKGVGGQYIREEIARGKLARLHAYRGRLFVDLKRLNEATESFRRAVDLDPFDRDSLLELGRLLVRRDQVPDAVPFFNAALELKPDDAETHYNLAVMLTGIGEHADAIAHYRDVLRMKPAWPPAANNLAWVLATHPDAKLRNGADAVRLARDVCQQVSYRDPKGLDTLAAALAETGEFNSAQDMLENAIQITRARGDKAFTEKLQERLRLYQSGTPFRDPQLAGSR